MIQRRHHSNYLWVLWVILLLLTLWAAALAAQSYLPGQNILQLFRDFQTALSSPFELRWTAQTPRFMFIFGIIYLVLIAMFYSSRKNTRHGEEHGSAKWVRVRQICKRHKDKQYTENILFTQKFRMGLNGHITQRNSNVLVIGGSGAGKTRTYVKPNVLQCNTSFILTDPKGEILRDTGHLLKAKGYEIKVFDLIHQSTSFGYSPFVYLRDDNDVLKFVNNIIKNTTDKKAAADQDFWPKAEALLFEALIMYLFHEAPPEEQSFGMLMDMLGCVEVKEEDESYISIIDTLFEILEEKDPYHPALKSYRGYKQAAGDICSK